MSDNLPECSPEQGIHTCAMCGETVTTLSPGTAPLSCMNVDLIATPTPELELMARRRVSEIVQKWAHLIAIWGTSCTHNKDGSRHEETFSVADLAVAAYVQGVRDTTAVNAVRERP